MVTDLRDGSQCSAASEREAKWNDLKFVAIGRNWSSDKRTLCFKSSERNHPLLKPIWVQDEEIAEELKNKKGANVYNIKRKTSGAFERTTIYIVAFDACILPK